MEREDLDKLFDRWNCDLIPWVIAQLRLRGVPLEEAEDATQVGCLREYKRRQKGKQPPKSEGGWLLTLAWRAFLTERYKQYRDAERGKARALAGMVRAVVDPTNEADPSELQEAVAAAMTCLQLEESNVVKRRFGRAMRISEIAQELGISSGRVRVRLARGLNKIGTALIKAGIDAER